MRTRPSLVAGAAAAALALTACGVAAGTSAGTPGGQAGSVSAGQPRTGIGITDLKDLAQVKRDAGQNAVDPAGARQPQMDTSALADLRDLAKLKRDSVWKAAGHTQGR
jgi:Spy/CpxP family protein refolding chaperone